MTESELGRARRSNSVAALEQLYYVIAGLAISNALTKVVSPHADTPPETRHYEFGLFLLFISVATRFVHGAATHFGTHQNAVNERGSHERFKRLQPLLDFVFFGVQASLFVVLSEHLSEPSLFMRWICFLLVWDGAWICITLVKDDVVAESEIERSALQRWVSSNVIVLAVLGLAAWSPDHLFTAGQRATMYGLVGIGAWVADYWFNRTYYFGNKVSGRSETSQATRTGGVVGSSHLVVLESPYAGDVASNVAFAQKCLLACIDRGEAPIASHLLFTQRGVLLDGEEQQRRRGMQAGHAWIAVAGKVVAYLDLGMSSGMRTGITTAVEHGIPVEFRLLDGTLDAQTLGEWNAEFGIPDAAEESALEPNDVVG